jgi:uncharacterized OB-fold protein
MGRFVERLSETAPTWAQAVAPVAERVVKAIWSTTTPRARKRSSRNSPDATNIVAKRTEVRSDRFRNRNVLRALCQTCGGKMPKGEVHCAACAAPGWRDNMREVAKRGRLVSHTPKAQAKRLAARRRNARAEAAWKPSQQPAWLTERVYVEHVHPKLAKISGGQLVTALKVSRPYAAAIRAGKRRPHPRHWLTLSRLVGLDPL